LEPISTRWSLAFGLALTGALMLALGLLVSVPLALWGSARERQTCMRFVNGLLAGTFMLAGSAVAIAAQFAVSEKCTCGAHRGGLSRLDMVLAPWGLGIVLSLNVRSSKAACEAPHTQQSRKLTVCCVPMWLCGESLQNTLCGSVLDKLASSRSSCLATLDSPISCNPDLSFWALVAAAALLFVGPLVALVRDVVPTWLERCRTGLQGCCGESDGGGSEHSGVGNHIWPPWPVFFDPVARDAAG
jgi:hypothetical protein